MMIKRQSEEEDWRKRSEDYEGVGAESASGMELRGTYAPGPEPTAPCTPPLAPPLSLPVSSSLVLFCVNRKLS